MRYKFISINLLSKVRITEVTESHSNPSGRAKVSSLLQHINQVDTAGINMTKTNVRSGTLDHLGLKRP
jgi:hypothetical protein